MPLTYSLTLPAPGDSIDATVLATLLTNIREAMSQITGTDILVNANIPGSAIASGSLPGDRVAARTITADRIGTQQITNAEVLDGTLKKGKFATATVDQITHAQLAITTQTLNFNSLTTGQSVTIGGTPAIPTASFDVLAVAFNFTVPVGVTTATCERGTSGGNHAVVVRCSGSGSISGAVDITYIAKT